MIDNNSVVSQLQELQVIIHYLLTEGMILTNAFVKHFKNILNIHIKFIVGLVVNEAFQVATIIQKLQPMWKDLKNYLKYKHKEMSVEDLIVRLYIKENNKAAERSLRGNFVMNRENFVEDNDNNSKKRKNTDFVK